MRSAAVTAEKPTLWTEQGPLPGKCGLLYRCAHFRMVSMESPWSGDSHGQRLSARGETRLGTYVVSGALL